MKKNSLYLIITALVLLNLFTLVKLNNLKNNVENRLQQSDFAVSSLRNEIDGIYSNVDTKLKKQASILDNHDVTFGAFNSNQFTVPLTVSITPKEYSKGMTASLQLNEKSIPMRSEGTTFVTTTDAYIFDDFKLKVILEQNGVKKTETIEEYYDLRNKFLLDITGGFEGQSSYDSNRYLYSGKIDLRFNSSESNSPEKVTLINDVNGKVIEERKVKASNPVTIDVEKNIKLAAGDKLTVYAIVQDRYGLQYKYILSVFELYTAGKPANEDHPWETRRIAEIRDSNGKVLYAPKYDDSK